MGRDETRDETKQHAQLTILYTDAIHQVMRPQPIIVCCVYTSDTAAGRPGRIRAFTKLSVNRRHQSFYHKS